MLTRPDSWTRTTDATAEPISLAQAKAHLRVDASDEDALITALITSVRQHLEGVTSRALINQTLKAYFSQWPCEGFELPGSPLSSVTSIKYTNTDGDEATVASDQYDVDTDATVGTVKLSEDGGWPTTSLRRNKPIVVEYVSGYDADGTLTPQPLIAAMKLHLGHLFENREQVVLGTISTDLPFAYESLVAPYGVWTL